jgi:hypothetical protein
MRHRGALFGRRFGAADVQPAVDLARVGIDDFRPQAFGQTQGKRSLTHTGRPDDGEDRRLVAPLS